MRVQTAVAVGVMALALTACGAPQTATVPQQAPAATSAMSLNVQTVAEGLDNPWGLAFLPDGAMLVTEKPGGLKRIAPGQAAVTIKGVPSVFYEGQGGLLDVSLHPRFAENQLIYLTMAAGTDDANGTRLVRARLQGDALSDVTTLWDQQPQKRGGAHFGGRILWLPDGTMLVSLGDRFAFREDAQKLDSALGKVVRLTEDGKPAPDNPFAGQANARPEIYTYGHRNAQGLARDPVSGRIYENEHGPQGGDEINVLQPGKNYGWPVITYGRDYSGAQISPFTERAGMEQPLVYWTPSIAPSALVFYTGDVFAAWKGDLFASALEGRHIRRVDLDADGRVLGQESLLADRGERYRNLVQGPDGALYALTDGIGAKVLKITPQTP